MAKSPNIAGSPQPSYPKGNVSYSYPAGRIIEVGTVAGFEAAIANQQPNDTIVFVWPGQYRLTATPVINVPGVHIMSAAPDPSDVEIVGPGMENSGFGAMPHGIFTQQAGLQLTNFTIRDVYQHAVTFAAGATAPQIRNMRLLDTGQQQIKAGVFPAAINDGIVEDCFIGYTGATPATDHGGGIGYINGIDIHNGARWQVRRTRFSNFLNPDTADPNNWWAPAVLFWNQSSDTLIEQCEFFNCQRWIALGLTQRGGGVYDHVRGIIRNNMGVLQPGLLSAQRIADSDGQIIAWDCPGVKILHNSSLSYGQISDTIQLRWENGEVSNNLSDDTIRGRDTAVVSGGNNVQNASASWFVNPATSDLRLNSTGNSNVASVTRLADCLDDIDGTTRGATTKIGAHVYG